MTRKERIECDGDWCDPTEEEPPQVVEQSDEWVEVDFDGYERHFCPVCSWQMRRWAMDGRSAGDYFVVQHNYIEQDFEEAHIGPGVEKDAVDNAGTHSMWVQPFLDEQNKIDGFIPDTMEGWHFHVHDHLGLTILGQHKSDPKVILEPSEFDTQFEVRETGSGYSFDKLLVEEGIEVERINYE